MNAMSVNFAKNRACMMSLYTGECDSPNLQD
jgi:hypothetical protein